MPSTDIPREINIVGGQTRQRDGPANPVIREKHRTVLGPRVSKCPIFRRRSAAHVTDDALHPFPLTHHWPASEPAWRVLKRHNKDRFQREKRQIKDQKG